MAVKDSAVPRLWGRECIPTALIGSIRFPQKDQRIDVVEMGDVERKGARPIDHSLIANHVFLLTTNTPSRIVTNTAVTFGSLATRSSSSLCSHLVRTINAVYNTASTSYWRSHGCQIEHHDG
jgi:hypothetical protein